MNLNNYDYFLPEANLALEPAVPRDSSKLFIYDTAVDKIIYDHFYNIDKYLPKDSFMVMNNTKVLPARVTMKKESGGKVMLLFLVNELEVMGDGLLGYLVKVMADRKMTVGEKVYFNQDDHLKVVGQSKNIFELQFNFSRKHLFDLLNRYGTMPIPPYLKKSTLSKDDLLKKYQTVFAKTDGSAAAPTASLHFTDSVFDKLGKRGIERLFVTLHVGLGTFAPITDENIKLKKLHEEYYEVEEKTMQCIDTLKKDGKKLVAVGTTVTRTLESLSDSGRASLARMTGKTDLFIFPPYNFKMADIMITNFHLPKSSLMMLVEAFLEDKYKKAPPSLKLRRAGKKSLVELYNIAIKNNFRFYSFGDAMLIL